MKGLSKGGRFLSDGELAAATWELLHSKAAKN